MKALARAYFRRPSRDAEIETLTKTCESCQENGKSPPKAPASPFPWPSAPWEQMHVAYAGPFLDKFLFIFDVCANSKWVELVFMNKSIISMTLEACDQCSHGMGCRIGHRLAFGNWPRLVSAEFEGFLRADCVQHTTIPPIIPSRTARQSTSCKP